MGDPASTLAGERLRRHLAEHDATCNGCGHNLRGVTKVTCPECGRVIESPEWRLDPDALAIKCHRCGYVLHGLPSAACPECGATDVTLADIDARIARGQRARVPTVLKMCGACGMLLTAWNMVFLVIWSPPVGVFWIQRALLWFVLPLTPAALVMFVYWRPGLLQTQSPRATLGRRMVASGIGLALLAVAFVVT